MLFQPTLASGPMLMAMATGTTPAATTLTHGHRTAPNGRTAMVTATAFNPAGTNGDAFPTDRQWSDADGDGYGDNPNGTTPDAFPSMEPSGGTAMATVMATTTWETTLMPSPPI